MELGLWIVIGGGIAGVFVLVVLAVCIVSKKRIQSSPPPKKDGMPNNNIP